MSSSTLIIFIVSLPFLFAIDIPDLFLTTEIKGCKNRGPLCCPRKNNSCMVSGPRLANLKSASCFCDEACVELGDCCLDYAIACPVQDCVLESNWGPWGGCSSRCGAGVRARSKTILKKAQNGGRACPANVQNSFCDGNKCKPARTGQHGHNELKEQARLISAKFAAHRDSKQFDPQKDIRKNLFEHQNQNQTQYSSYCAYFRISDSHHSCSRSDSWTQALRIGADVCVECQNLSIKRELGGRCLGHGVIGKVTEWKAMMRKGCHGRWVLTYHHQQQCSCDANSELSFVFV